MCSPDGTYLCKNGGICRYDDTHEEITCFCPYSHEGKYCERGKFLVPLPSIIFSNGILYFHGYTYITDKCLANGTSICENGGICHVKPSGKIDCTCTNQYSGAHCEVGN